MPLTDFTFTVGLFVCTMLIGACQSEDLAFPVSGHDLYQSTCATCHQIDGRGVPGAYPSLDGSTWASGDKGRLIRLVLNGMRGRHIANGQTYNNAMTPHGFLSDEQIAAVLTFVRSSFHNEGGAVTAEEVASVRQSNRQIGLWAPTELQGAVGIPTEAGY